MNRSVVTHHSTAWWRSQRATSRWMASRVRRRRSGRGGKRVAWATSASRSAPLAQLEPDQEAVSQHHGYRMPMEAGPQPPLRLIPAQLAFGLFMERLDGIPPLGIAGQLFQGGRGRQSAPVILACLGWPRVARSPSGQPTCRWPSRGTRQQRMATTFFRRHSVEPCRHRIVRHCQRGRACSS
jgi:hypothetical protein